MEKLYSKFFGEKKNPFGHSSFNNPSAPINTNKNYTNVKIQITNKNENNITLNSSNFTEINNKIPQTITKEEVIKSMPSSNPVTSAARPINFTKNDFTSFNTFAFNHNPNRKPKQEIFPHNETKNLQILREKKQNIESKKQEDRSNLMEIIESNILNKSELGLNQSAKEEELKEEINNIDRLNSNEEKMRIKSSSDISPLNENNQILKENNFYLTPNHNQIKKLDKNNARINSNFYNDNDKVNHDLQKIRDELILQLQDQALISKDNYQQTEMNINKLRNDFAIKIDFLENKQKLQLETLRYILEHSEDRKIRDVTAKVMDHSSNIEEEEGSPPRKIKEESKRPKTERKPKKVEKVEKKEKVEKVEKVEKKVKKKIPKMQSPSDSENDDLKNYIEARQTKNKQLQEDILKEDNIEIENNADRKKEKLAEMKEKINQKQKLQTEKIEKELEKFKHKDFM